MLDQRNSAGDAPVTIPVSRTRLQARCLPLLQSRIGRSAPLFTRSRRSLPGLKCGTYLPASATASPVFGLRPWRGGRKCSEKLPKPRISIRSPWASESLMISSICFSASSTSFAGRCFCFAVMISISSDFVMAFPGCERLTAIRPVDLLLEQIPEAGSRGRHFRPIALHRLRFFVNLFRLDRQRDGAGLAIHADELGLHLVADLQYRTRIVHPIAAEFRGAQLALDAVAQVDHGTARIHVLDRALDDTALRILGNEGRERVLGKLLDTERDALALRIDRQHHGLDLLCLLVVAHRLLARLIPGVSRQAHHSIDLARQGDEDPEVGDRLDLPRDAIAAIVIFGKLLPRVGLALLQAQ